MFNENEDIQKSYNPIKFYMNTHVQGPLYNPKLYSDRVNKINSNEISNQNLDRMLNIEQNKAIDQKQKLKSLQSQDVYEKMSEGKMNSINQLNGFTRYQDYFTYNSQERQFNYSNQSQMDLNQTDTLLDINDDKLPPGLSKRTIRDYKKKSKKETFKVSNEDIYEAYKHHSLVFQQQKNQSQNKSINDQSIIKEINERSKTTQPKLRSSNEHRGQVDIYRYYLSKGKEDKINNRNGIKLQPLKQISLNSSINALNTIKEGQDDNKYAQKNKLLNTTTQKQKNPTILPLTKIFFLNRINKFDDLRINFINIDIQPFIFSHFRKEIQSSIDIQVLERAYPYIQKVLNTNFADEFYANLAKYPDKKRDFEDLKLGNAKKDIMKIFNDFETEYISEKSLFERIIYYFIPSPKQQVVIDFIGSINNIGDNSFKNYQNIECVFDVNGREINDILNLHYQTLILLGGERETMKRNEFLRDLEQFIEIQSNRQFRDTLRQKAQSNFDTQLQISKSPFDSPRKNRSYSQISRNQAQMRLFQDSAYETNDFQGGSIHYDNSFNYPQNSYQPQSPYNRNQKRESQQSMYGGNDMILDSNTSNFKLNSILQEGIIDFKNKQLINGGINSSMKKAYIPKSIREQSKMQTKELMRVRSMFPQLTNKDIFRYYSEFQSLINLNEGFESNFNITQKIPKNSNQIYALNFFSFCTQYKNNTHAHLINTILRAIGIDVEVNDRNLIRLCWDKFLLLRVLMEQKGEKEHIIDFLLRLFDPKKIGVISRNEYLEIMQTSDRLINEKGEEAKIYAHQMWNYFFKNDFMNEQFDLVLSQIEEKYQDHRYSYVYFLNWILNNFDESSELEIQQV